MHDDNHRKDNLQNAKWIYKGGMMECHTAKTVKRKNVGIVVR